MDNNKTIEETQEDLVNEFNSVFDELGEKANALPDEDEADLT